MKKLNTEQIRYKAALSESGESGEDYGRWMEEWSSFSFDDVEVELPEDVEMPEVSLGDFEALPETME